MRPSTVTQVGPGASPHIPVDIYCPNNNKGVFVDVLDTVSYTVQITADDVFDPLVTPVWFDVTNTNLVGATDNQQGTVITPCRAIRVSQTGEGSTRLSVIQQSLS